MSDRIEDMMSHLEKCKVEDSNSGECDNCSRSWSDRRKVRKISDSNHPPGGNSKTKKNWVDIVCPDCGSVQKSKRSRT